jgi:hypothetical protein
MQAIGGHEESQMLPSLTSVPARNRRRARQQEKRRSFSIEEQDKDEEGV